MRHNKILFFSATVLSNLPGFFLISVFSTWLSMSSLAFAIPEFISYQGVLKDDSGNYLTGTYSIQFNIYAASTGGSPLWTETQSSVSVSSGKFSVQLGSISALDLDFDQNYWLSIKVGADDEMTPRVQLTSVGYAYRANVAEDVINGFTEAEHNTLSHSNIQGVMENKTLIAKTNFKLDAFAEASANSLGNMFIDTFMNDEGISAIPSSGYTWRGSPDFDVIASSGGIDSDVPLAIHANGSDASTSFTDASPSMKTITANGNAQIDTAQSKFGGASALFDGSGDYLSIPDSADWDFGTGDFTIDFWIRYNSVVNGHYPFSHGTSPTLGLRYASGQLNVYLGGSTPLAENWSPSTGVWYHIAITRDGTNLRLFVDGTQLGSTVTNSTDITGATTALSIGAFNDSSNGHNGWIDEFRITKGVARWTSAFTPPSVEYSSAAGIASIISVASTAAATPSTAMIISDETLNAGETTYFVSRNNGANWTECLKETLCDISSQPSGTQIKWKAEIEDDAELNAIAVAI